MYKSKSRLVEMIRRQRCLESDKKIVLGLRSCQSKLEAKVSQMEEDLFLVKAKMRTQALSRSALVGNNPIVKKSANDRSEVSRKEDENPIKDNIEIKAEEDLIENGLGESRVKAPKLSPSHLM